MSRKNILITICLFCIFVTLYYILNTDIFINNSLDNLQKLFFYMFHPAMDETVKSNIVTGYYNTFIISITGLILGVYIALLLNFFATKFIKVKIGKYISILFRSVHEIILIYLLMMIFGLNIYIAIFAIGISYGGSICKVFTDNMNETSMTNYKAYKNRKISYKNYYMFNLQPTHFKSNVTYVFYRLECAIRSSIVLSYVGIPGIGFYLSMALNDTNYSNLFAYLYSLIIFVIIFSIITGFIKTKITSYSGFVKVFIPVSIIILLTFLLTHLVSFTALFQAQNLNGLLKSVDAIKSLVLLDHDFYTKANITKYFYYTVQTISLGIIATVFMVLFLFVSLFFFVTDYCKDNKVLIMINNAISVTTRSMPEIVILTFLLFVFKPSIVSGALALAIHNFGILNNIVKDRFYHNYKTKFTAYKNRNIKPYVLFIFVFIPMLGRDLVNLIFYRFEMIIKSSVVVGILGSGGLGYLLRLNVAMGDFKGVYFVVFIYFVLLLLLEKLNNKIVNS